ncbi:hypothetical protein CDAR_456331 [Caerostris darwini]|uniref:Uncharacterized protein n=1 Tax=Caerostris darwini TaxID=1538125 RepID=A0AAV4QBV4_9ARAC|nr:hypothetical protein CDAR_456331 [Caerostris darwini]
MNSRLPTNAEAEKGSTMPRRAFFLTGEQFSEFFLMELLQTQCGKNRDHHCMQICESTSSTTGRSYAGHLWLLEFRLLPPRKAAKNNEPEEGELLISSQHVNESETNCSDFVFVFVTHVISIFSPSIVRRDFKGHIFRGSLRFNMRIHSRDLQTKINTLLNIRLLVAVLTMA